MWSWILFAGGLIILVLAVVAVRLQLQVAALKRQRQSEQLALEQAERDQRDRINKSIQIIAQGVESDQLSLTEASIRIKVLLDSLGVDDSVRAEYTAFYQLAKATDHIPILAQWKQLTLKKRVAFDRERETLEGEYRDFVLDAAKRIRGKTF
ncbi:DUF2489 domain-containing protein [Exilibacterium tricleocarpae]|uniref:DUF2489 domain-containing protein n=1 Tax=Exilibacterium tricleocarpae TaxID=2591008 RepID=A0A545T8A4_9GAMM|nr:DUF2489 domain-containing protein [Exilibacterium tricleocarpae]TQV73452.1 DUF2489 domain-containing protein [Exilibacterium tricleocarpae]